jgi:tricorn protease
MPFRQGKQYCRISNPDPSCAALTASAQDPFMQYPDIQGNTIVFASGGDLWKVAADGGTACRLTFSDGRETYPEISPDAAWFPLP